MFEAETLKNNIMSEFSIRVDQSLVTKTLDQIGPYPYNVFKYPAPSESLLNSQENIGLEMPVSYAEMQSYTEESLDLLKNQAENFFATADADETYADNDTISNIVALIEHESKNDTSQLFATEEKLSDVNEKKDAIVYATLVSANYIIENGRLFTSEEDKELLAQAKKISEEDDLENFLFTASFDKGLGGFIRRIWRRGKKLFRSILRWTKKQLEKIIKIKFELAKLEIDMTRRPNFLLGNPLRIRSLDLRVRIIRVDLKYRIFGKWRRISFTLGNKVELKSSARFALSTESNKVFVLPRFDKVKFRIKILGIWFTIGLTKVVNVILANRGKLMVYDLSGLVTPMQIKGLEYSIADIQIPLSQQYISLDVNIDVKKAS